MNGLYYLGKYGFVKVQEAWAKLVILLVASFLLGTAFGYFWRSMQ